MDKSGPIPALRRDERGLDTRARTFFIRTMDGAEEASLSSYTLHTTTCIHSFSVARPTVRYLACSQSSLWIFLSMTPDGFQQRARRYEVQHLVRRPLGRVVCGEGVPQSPINRLFCRVKSSSTECILTPNELAPRSVQMSPLPLRLPIGEACGRRTSQSSSEHILDLSIGHPQVSLDPAGACCRLLGCFIRSRGCV
mgnify:CR=1 FL=1|jgi:hypothetical protein